LIISKIIKKKLEEIEEREEALNTTDGNHTIIEGDLTVRGNLSVEGPDGENILSTQSDYVTRPDDLIFRANNDGGQRLTINGDGNVGIGGHHGIEVNLESGDTGISGFTGYTKTENEIMKSQNKLLKEKNKKFVKENEEMRNCLKSIYESKNVNKRDLNWIEDILGKHSGEVKKKDKYKFISRD